MASACGAECLHTRSWFVNRMVAFIDRTRGVNDFCHRHGDRVREASNLFTTLMTTERAEILATDHPSKTAARIIINASASKIFDLLANPSSHRLFDGSGTIQNSISGPERLFLGAQFSMDMKIKIPYRIKNTVVAFEEDKQIAWCHLMKWRWQYELIDLGNGTTQVTESFDASNIPFFAKHWLRITGAIAHNPKWMAKSLVKLKAICEGANTR